MPDRQQQLLAILGIARETSHRGRGLSLRDALLETCYSELKPNLEAGELIPLLSEHPELVEDWIAYSQDKRTSEGWALLESGEIYCVETEAREAFESIERATAEYVIREMNFSLTCGDQ